MMQNNPTLTFVTSLACIIFLWVNKASAQNDALTLLTESLKKNVIAIRANFEEDGDEKGFGFIVGEQNNLLYVVTAAHVVRGVDKDKNARSIRLKFYTDLRWYEASFVYHWDKEDLALLELAKPAALTNWRRDCADLQPRIYQKVRFIGQHGNEPNWVDPGLDGNIFQDNDPELNFAIGTIRPGTSGAPLITARGIVGMITKDDMGSSTALKLTQIQKLLSGGGQYSYFGLQGLGASTPPINPSTQNQPVVENAAEEDEYGLIRVKGGTFTMGCTTEQGSDCEGDEKPSHQVTVNDFSIGKHEVTQAQWRAVMGSDPPELDFKGCDQCPVERVSWNDVQEFLRKLNSKTGKQYRLPTEAEWEYAARGGNQSRGYKYAGGNLLIEVAWFTENSDSKTHLVAQKKANELGLYDMSGNVWEWCQDRYGENYSRRAQTNPTGAALGSYRIYRGGGWGFYAGRCRVSFRHRDVPTFRSNGLGFRLAL
ncbi:SUMF1/EgtB/PvdO family nonheme iron enzyme [Haliscomenobacter hydrossis]|uniref:Sulphatase-modifying factor protein n=1 Tax=Haliscomenobacter hydrossis (strain ATCC 27775 / DSM 1100 / LMG 10767 / O) TaxID=760192 RepID=F4KY93_HALH1|nr:SUMF1/EgtB/PvdO family nonheme iron enzyme [Haliscomenobacter hydrossis]AEE48356.1 Sulphatase-modifying factor protein [Haliscomenobacter hydrossis DSM 1100]